MTHLVLLLVGAASGLTPGAPELELTAGTQSVLAITFSPDGGALVTAGLDRTVRSWPLDGGGPTAVLDGGENAIDALAFSADATRLAFGDQAFWAHVVQWPSLAAVTEVVHPSAVSALAFDPKGDQLVVSSPGSTANVYALPSGKAKFEVRSRCAAWSRDGGALVAAQSVGAIAVFDGRSGKVRSTFSTAPHVAAALVLLDDQTAITSSPKDGALRLWDLKRGKAAGAWSGHEGGVHSLSLSADHRRLASTGVEHTVRVWDTASGRTVFERPVEHTAFAALSPDGRTLAVADGAAIKVWRLPAEVGPADAGSREPSPAKK